MMDAWTVKDAAGRLAVSFVGYSKGDVERKVVGTAYNAHALAHDAHYRALFEEELRQELSDRGYQIVPVRLVERDE